MALYFLLPHEPSYNGKGLSAWLQDFESNRADVQELAADALRHMGAQAVPALVDRLDYSSQFYRLKQKVLEFLNKQSFLKISLGSPADLRRQAFTGLDALGPAAKGALPALEKILHEDPPDGHAIYIVARIGQEGLPLLKKSLTNENKVVRLGAGVCLDMINPRSKTLYFQDETGFGYSDFNRRMCEFNVKILRASFETYKAQFSEHGHLQPGFDGRPPPTLPPSMQTNGSEWKSDFQTR